MGKMSSVQTVGHMIGFYLVIPLFLILPATVIWGKYRLTFILSSCVILVSLLLTLRLTGWDNPVEREKLYFRKKYLKYYILEVFVGARKQVFMTFAPYVLIVNYDAKTQLISSLYGISTMATIIVAPLVGKLLDKIGYKKIILVDSLLLIFVCFIYGFSHRIFTPTVAFVVVSVIFVIDAVLFTVGMSRAMYVKTLSKSSEEVTSTLSTGLSINHFVSIFIAMGGGLLWEALGVETLFSLAAVFGLGSFLFAFTLPKPQFSADTRTQP
jgi:predicted MFS family arabinose efflux permease